MKKAIIDSKTSDITISEMSESEIQEIKIAKKSHTIFIEEQAAKEAARQSALDKLAALGLSAEEVAAIMGAN